MTPADYIRSKVRLDDVHVIGGRRPVDQSAVSALAASMSKIGLMIPISIRVVDDVMIEDQPIRAAVLVAGRHRLEAARQLGWKEIDCVYMQGDETDARMWEIAENLHRAELTALERDEQIAEWVKLASKKEEEVSRQVDAKPRGGRPEGGTRAAARELGLSEPDARRATKVASLSPEAKEVARELGLDDNRSVLLAAAKAPDATAFLRNQPAVKQADKAISLTNAEQFAEWLLARTDLDELPTLISWLEGTKPGDVIRALRRQSA